MCVWLSDAQVILWPALWCSEMEHIKGLLSRSGDLHSTHHWHHFTLSVSKVHSLLICWRNGRDNDDACYVRVSPLPHSPCKQTARWLTSLVSYVVTSPLVLLLYDRSSRTTVISFFSSNLLMSFCCDISRMVQCWNVRCRLRSAFLLKKVTQQDVAFMSFVIFLLYKFISTWLGLKKGAYC